MEIDQLSLSRSQHPTILGYSQSPSFYLRYRLLHQPRPVFVMLFLLLLLCTVVVNLSITKPYHQPEDYPYKTVTDCGEPTDGHNDQQPCVILTAYSIKVILPHSLYAILQRHFRIILD